MTPTTSTPIDHDKLITELVAKRQILPPVGWVEPGRRKPAAAGEK